MQKVAITELYYFQRNNSDFFLAMQQSICQFDLHHRDKTQSGWTMVLIGMVTNETLKFLPSWISTMKFCCIVSHWIGFTEHWITTSCVLFVVINPNNLEGYLFSTMSPRLFVSSKWTIAQSYHVLLYSMDENKRCSFHLW